MCVCRSTFTQEAHQPPDEVAAAVAEGGSGQGHFLQAVTQRGAPAPGPPAFSGHRASCPAVGGIQVRCDPDGLSHALHARSSPEGTGPLGSWRSKQKSSHSDPELPPAPKANYPDPNRFGLQVDVQERLVSAQAEPTGTTQRGCPAERALRSACFPENFLPPWLATKPTSRSEIHIPGTHRGGFGLDVVSSRLR